MDGPGKFSFLPLYSLANKARKVEEAYISKQVFFNFTFSVAINYGFRWRLSAFEPIILWVFPAFASSFKHRRKLISFRCYRADMFFLVTSVLETFVVAKRFIETKLHYNEAIIFCEEKLDLSKPNISYDFRCDNGRLVGGDAT